MDRTQGRQDRLARTQSGGFECLVNMYSVIDVSPPDDYPSWCVRDGDPWTRDVCVCSGFPRVCRIWGGEEGMRTSGWKLSAYPVAQGCLLCGRGELGTGPTTRAAFFCG